MKGKIIAKVKKEKMDIEAKDQWMSFDGESMEDFRKRIQEGGSNPDNFNYTDPIEEDEKEEIVQEIVGGGTEYIPIADTTKSIIKDLSIFYYAKELQLIDENTWKQVVPFLRAAVKAHLTTIPMDNPNPEPQPEIQATQEEVKQTLNEEIIKQKELNEELEKEMEEAENVESESDNKQENPE